MGLFRMKGSLPNYINKFMVSRHQNVMNRKVRLQSNRREAGEKLARFFLWIRIYCVENSVNSIEFYIPVRPKCSLPGVVGRQCATGGSMHRGRIKGQRTGTE